jgi:CRISPR/Cas system CSM-associated protein Csm2 small subunit
MAKFEPSKWIDLVLSTDTFFNIITNVTGHELTAFIETCVDRPAHVCFQVENLRMDFSEMCVQVSYSFNRKRSVLELEIKQEADPAKGQQR